MSEEKPDAPDHLVDPIIEPEPSRRPIEVPPGEEAVKADPKSGPRKKKRAPKQAKPLRQYHLGKGDAPYSITESLTNLGKFWLNPWSVLNAVIFAALSFVLIYQASIYWLAVIDDSYITFRFVDMFVKGYGWSFNPEGPRVEGLTNFLWAFFLVIPHALGWDLMFFSKIMGLVCGVLTMAGVWGMARAIRGRDDIFNMVPVFLLATNSYFAHWTLMGLETLMQTALITWCYYRFEMERRDLRMWQLSPLIAVLAAMTRIDSLYYLSPLGAYGLWLVCFSRIPLRRMLIWGLLAAIPFFLFWGWKYTYFGDILPNTYYAKQRLVHLNSGRPMGEAQLDVFYFKQAGFELREPTAPDRLTTEGMDRFLQQLDYAWHKLPGLGTPSYLWFNFWMCSLVLCMLAAVAPVLVRGARKLFSKDVHEFVLDVHFGKIVLLILLPWGMNVYYIHHVNGDWMPSFRFFQVGLCFIGVAGAVGFGAVYQLIRAMMDNVIVPVVSGIASFIVVGYLLLGNAYEQLWSGSISVYGAESVYWGQRAPNWFLPGNVEAAYSKGFVPPLKDVSDYLLLETQDDAYIFMSDIGQPLWFAEHLGLYDVDGLTDPWLAHAPSRRGTLASKEERLERLVAEAEKAGREYDLKDLELRATREYFDATLERNGEYIMDRRRPEYLLIFLNHQRPDPKSQGWPYPEISRVVYEHENMKDYVDDEQIPKIGNVFNHIFRREDVPREVPDLVKAQRLQRVLERNPRMPYLIGLAFKVRQDLKEVPPGFDDFLHERIMHAYEHYSDDPVVAEIGRMASSSHDKRLALVALEKSLKQNPRNVDLYWSISRIHQDQGDYKAAIQSLRGALPYIQPKDNAVHYHLAWLAENSGDIKGAIEILFEARDRDPKDVRTYIDLAAIHERGSWRTEYSPEEQLENAKKSVEFFEKVVELSNGKPPSHIPGMIKRLNEFIKERTESLETGDLQGPPAPSNGMTESERNTLESAGISVDARPETSYDRP